jgi:predicted nucleotidyltransferase component of viral defense system
MNKPSKNHAASVRAKLLLLSKQRQEMFQFTLERYALERLLFRLSQTDEGSSFLLKGGMLLNFISQSPYRSTRDLDLLGYGDASAERLITVFKAACNVEYPEDGLIFSEEIQTSPIKQEKEYPGIRVKLKAGLDQAVIDLQVDIGFGDAVLQPHTKIDFKPFLDFPVPDIYAYPLESVLAEKIHAMVELGSATSRMKDIYDLWYLANLQDWLSERLIEAVQLTFNARKTLLPQSKPEMFLPLFFNHPQKLAQWNAFEKRLSRAITHKQELSVILQKLEIFWWPLLSAMQKGTSFRKIWDPQGWSWCSLP